MVELICKKHTFMDKKSGQEKVGMNYFIKTESGLYICIRPVFDDYQKLRVLSKLED